MRWTLIVLLAASLLACTPRLPYRTQLAMSPGSTVPPQCAGMTAPGGARSVVNHETTEVGDLYFVEFDDQGLLYPPGRPEFGAGACHIEALMADLSELAKKGGLSILVYVHGWKHNASDSNIDVEAFRLLLRDADLVERAKEARSGKRHRVVGVYVAWRGKSLDLPEPLLSLSFWDRKQTAQHVAVGESRALFARLRAFQVTQNGGPAIAGTTDPSEKKVLMILMGHSFGGLILYSAVAQSLINSLYEASASADGKKIVPRFADMIIVANPAVEALRYTPLHRAATGNTYDRYQSPIFVSVTSTADWATRIAFPAGRYISTVFQTHASDEEREANRNTIGHVERYITHELVPGGGACTGWQPVDPAKPETHDHAGPNLKLEIENAARFFGKDPDSLSLEAQWKRAFCGGTTLIHRSGPPNSPVWNIRTTKEIVPGHNNIKEPRFINFVRQLYHDVVLKEFIRAEAQSPGTTPVPPAR